MKIKYLRIKFLLGFYIGIGVSSIVFLGIPVRKQLEYVLTTVKDDSGKVEIYIQDIIGGIYITIFMMMMFFILGLHLIVTDTKNKRHAEK